MFGGVCLFVALSVVVETKLSEISLALIIEIDRCLWGLKIGWFMKKNIETYQYTSVSATTF